MLETVREFAEERLTDSGEEDAVRHVHAAYYRAVAARYELAELLAESDLAAIRLEAEHPNLRAALSWLEVANEPDLFVQLAAALGRFWSGQGHYQEGRTWLERAIALPGAARPDRAKALVLLGIIEIYQGAYQQAEGWLTEGLAACRAANDPFHTAYGLLYLGGLAAVQGDHLRAIALLEQVPIEAQRVPDRRLADILTGLALINLVVPDRAQGHHGLAASRLEEALRLVRDAGYTSGMVLALIDLGDQARDEGDYPRALEQYQDALGLVRGHSHTRNVIDALAGVAMVAAATGHADTGARLMGAAEALRDQIGYRYQAPEIAPAHDRAVTMARSALGEARFAAAWAAGQHLRADQAVAEALSPFGASTATPSLLLSPREVEILSLVASGLTDREIGAALFLSHRTVGNHVARITARLGVHSRAAAVETARAAGFLPPAAS